jgi:integrase
MASLIKRRYKVTLPDGTVEQRECEHWTIRYRTPDGKQRDAKAYKDKSASKQLMARLERNAARGEVGLVDPFKAHRHAPLTGHVKDYLADLRATGRDDGYCYRMERRLNRLVAEIGWTCLNEIEVNGFVRWREAERKNEAPRKGRMVEKGASATTLNQYLDSLRGFANWCATKGRMPGIDVAGGRKIATALAGIEKVEGEKVRNRRGLSDEQIIELLKVSAAERGLVYRFGIATGLRRQEIADLQWGDVRLRAIQPFLALRAEATKARRADRVPLPPTLADELRERRGEAKDNEPVFPVVPDIDQWKADLVAAGIPYKDESGRQADFHGGCRKTLCTRLHKSGVPQLAAMRRMRVTDPKLLNDTYVDDGLLGADATVLPEVLPPVAKQAAAAAQ